MLEQAHGSAYLRDMHDHQRGFDPAPEGRGASGVQREAIRRVERELTAVRIAEGRRRGLRSRLRRRGGGAGAPRPIEPGTRDGPRTGGRGAESSRRRDGQGLPAGIRRPDPRGQPCRRRCPAASGELRHGGDRRRRPGADRASLRPAARAGPRSETTAARGPRRAQRLTRGARRAATRSRAVVTGAQPVGGGETAGGTSGRGADELKTRTGGRCPWGKTGCVWPRLAGFLLAGKPRSSCWTVNRRRASATGEGVGWHVVRGWTSP